MVKKILVLVIAFWVGAMCFGHLSVEKSRKNGLDALAVQHLSFFIVGDNLITWHVLETSWRKEINAYDFSPLYQNLESDIRQADISVINQEGVLVPDMNASGRPRYGTPYSMGDTIANLGFDIVLGANNHSLDKGLLNLYKTREYFENRKIVFLGMDKAGRIVEKNGIKLGLFNYTYGINSSKKIKQSDVKYVNNLKQDKNIFIDSIIKMDVKVDFTICFLHIGVEYMSHPSNYQKEWIKKVIDAGADLVICSHPHVLQKCEYVTTESGNQALVYYSLGNFVACQDLDIVKSQLGGVVKLQLVKKNEDMEIKKYEIVPIITHETEKTVKIYYLSDYTKELADLSYTPKFDYYQKLWKKVKGDKE